MAAYNAAEFIKESIKSVLNQTYFSWELLIVDDGSTDNTKTIIAEFAKDDKRIQYYYQQNGKQGKARNSGIARAKGKYIAFIDADDIWLPEKIEIQVKQIEEKKVELVFSDAYTFTGTITDSLATLNSGKGIFKDEVGIKSFLELNKIPTSTVLAKTEIINKVNGFTESSKIPQAEDYHLWLKLLMSGFNLFGSELILAGYRRHTSATTTADKLAVSYVIEAFEDLKHTYKPYKILINTYQKLWFEKYHYSTNNWSKLKYKTLIKRNCDYVNKRTYNFILQMIYALFGIKLTRKLISRFINNPMAT